MFRTGARGARVSPDPWGSDNEEEPVANTIDDEIEMQEPTRQRSPPREPTPPPKEPKVPPKEPKQPVNNEPVKNNKDVKNNAINGDTKPKPPRPEFVYQRNSKKDIDNDQLDKYLKARFSTATRAWTPYLGERYRQLLLQGPIKPSKGFKYRIKHNWKKFKISWNEFTYSLEVWKGSIKKIEGHQGTGVVSYFVFLRWLFFLNFFIFLLCFWVITFFQVAFTEADYDKDTMGVDDSGSFPGVATAETCSALYKPNVTTDALSLVLDFIQGTGWMETTAMFYGYYTNKELTLAASEYNMPLAYFLTALVVLLVSLIFMLRNTVSGFKEAQIAKSSKQSVYCNAVFAGWDYSIIEDEATIIKQKSLYRGLCAEIEEQRFQMKRTSRTTEEKCKLYTVRFLINFLIIVMLGGAGAAIYFAQDFSTSFTTSSDAANYHSLVLLLVEFLPSIVIGLCNGIYPLIFGILVNFEEYRPAFVIKISLVRQVFLRLASLAILIVSLYIQITCNTQNFCLVGTGDCPAIQCWETYVGSAIYKLLVMDFFIDVGVTLGVELPRKLITTKCECGLLNKVGPAEFDIPKNVLDLVYAQILCWLGFFFAPLVPAICVFRFFVLFYLKKLSALFNTVPPEKPYQASKSNSFFMFILLVAYFMICIPVGYVLVR